MPVSPIVVLRLSRLNYDFLHWWETTYPGWLESMYWAQVFGALGAELATMAEHAHHLEAGGRSGCRPALERELAAESCPQVGFPWRQQWCNDPLGVLLSRGVFTNAT